MTGFIREADWEEAEEEAGSGEETAEEAEEEEGAAGEESAGAPQAARERAARAARARQMVGFMGKLLIVDVWQIASSLLYVTGAEKSTRRAESRFFAEKPADCRFVKDVLHIGEGE